MKFIFLLGIVLSSRLLAVDCLLFFDVNKTIIMEDKAGKKSRRDVINGMLAENVEELFFDWTGSGNKEPYYEYVTRLLNLKYSGQKLKDMRLKYIRENIYADFSAMGAEKSAKEIYETINKKLQASDVYNQIIPSFVDFLLKWDDWVSSEDRTGYLVMRTFGSDVKDVKSGFAKILKRKISWLDGRINSNGDLEVGQQAITPSYINDFIASQDKRYVFIQDNYKRWRDGNFEAAKGKPFPVFNFSCCMFFDDNVYGAEHACMRDIVYPFDSNGFIAPASLLQQGNLVKVNPYKATINSGYFWKIFSDRLRGGNEN